MGCFISQFKSLIFCSMKIELVPTSNKSEAVLTFMTASFKLTTNDKNNNTFHDPITLL